MTHTLTQDFRAEYEAERTQWLRRRFLWYSGVLGSVMLLNLLTTYLFSLVGPALAGRGEFVGLILVSINGLPQAALLWGAFLQVRHRTPSQQQLLRLVFWLTVITGSISVVTSPFFTQLGFEQAGDAIGPSVAWDMRFFALLTVFITHFVASLFIPWTPREAMRPLIPLLGVLALVALLVGIGGGGVVGRVVFIVISPVVGVPGVAVCWWRHSRFRQKFHYRMLRGRYGELQRELVDARQVHEELFPAPVLEGPICFHYRYEPMRELGGDYLYAHHQPPLHDEPGFMHMVLIDVTGHGVKAALTVNRIYGELERIFAENPEVSPGELMLVVNRYVRLTLAKHSVYATAITLKFEPHKDRLEYVNAGHPPLFLRTAGGLIDQLDSTAPLLGVFARDVYEPAQKTLRFGPGDTLIAYTDGATDTANEAGDRLNIDGILHILAADKPEPLRRGRWTGTLAREINRHRFGAAVDDTLLVEVWRPIEGEGKRGLSRRKTRATIRES